MIMETVHVRSLNAYLRERFGEKVYKLALDGGFTCPTRDGTIDTRGCIFCAGGSGAFTVPVGENVHAAIEQAKTLVADKGGKNISPIIRAIPGPTPRWSGCAPCTRRRFRIRTL